jgi:hypothetical protein
MGRRREGRYDVTVRRYLTPRCLGLHAVLLLLLPAFAWLTRWQYERAQSGNTLSWAYVCLWPAFGVYAVYTWWQLIHDQAAKVPGRPRSAPAGSATPGHGAGATGTSGAAGPALPPGWALTGGRDRNVAIASAAPIDAERGGRGERYAAQTPEEAARLAAYNRYLAELADEDSAEASASGRPGAPS